MDSGIRMWAGLFGADFKETDFKTIGDYAKYPGAGLAE